MARGRLAMSKVKKIPEAHFGETRSARAIALQCFAALGLRFPGALRWMTVPGGGALSVAPEVDWPDTSA